MIIKFLFITSRYFFQPTIDALSRLTLDCGTKVVPYDDFGHIAQVYEQYAGPFDAVFVSGTSAKQAIDQQISDHTKPVIAYQVSSDALHRDILRFAIETQNLDFSRIAMDFLLPLERGYSVVDYLQMKDPSVVITENNEVTQSIGVRESGCLEDVILEKIIRMWNEGAIDLVICQYSSIVPTLQKLGIPYRCPFLSDYHLKCLIEEAMVRIELKRLHDNHPAIVQIFLRHGSSGSSRQFQQLRQHVQQYVEANFIECVIQETNNCCVLISSMQILRFLTNNFQICQISSYLENALSFPVAVGYGIGTSISHAMNNAQIASKEAKLVGKSFAVDTNGTLIGPLNAENRMVIPANSMPNVSEIAKRCGLSSMTIQKILAIIHSNGSDKITTQDLAQRLNTTIRNANRIMLNLCRGNVAKPVYTQSSHSRGRPIQVYALDFGLS